MFRIIFALPLLLLLAQPAAAQVGAAVADPTCRTEGGIVGVVKKGDEMIFMSCPEVIGTDPFLCTCHRTGEPGGKCAVYPCNAKGQSKEEAPDTKPMTADNLPLASDPAIAALQMKANDHDPQAQFDLGMEFMKGKAFTKNPPEALRLWRASADQGYAKAQFYMGLMHILGGANGDHHSGPTTEDAAEAFTWFSRAAAQGDAPSAGWLGSLYSEGPLGLPKNNVEAYFWYSLGAQLSLNMSPQKKEGMFNVLESHDDMVASALRIGNLLTPVQIADVQQRLLQWKPGIAPLTPVAGVPPAPPTKEELQKQAVEKARQELQKQEEARKQAIDAQKQEKIRKEKERVDAIAAAQQAKAQTKADALQLKNIQQKAAAHDPQAEFDLGYIYVRGNGIKPQMGMQPDDEKFAGEWRVFSMMPPGVMLDQSISKGLEWYHRAADQGQFEAQYNLGMMNLYGRGVPADKKEAYFWFSLAATSGVSQSNNEIFLNNPGLTPEEIAEVKQRVLQWKRKPYETDRP